MDWLIALAIVAAAVWVGHAIFVNTDRIVAALATRQRQGESPDDGNPEVE